MAYQLQRLAEVAKAAIVVEGCYPGVFRPQPGRGSLRVDAADGPDVIFEPGTIVDSARMAGWTPRKGAVITPR